MFGQILQTRNQHLINHRGFNSRWMFQWIVSGMFQRNLTFQWYGPKDCHLSSGCLLEFAPMDFQRRFPMDVPFVISGV